MAGQSKLSWKTVLSDVLESEHAVRRNTRSLSSARRDAPGPSRLTPIWGIVEFILVIQLMKGTAARLESRGVRVTPW